MPVIMGIGAFAFFFLSDYNDWKLARRYLKWCFPAGAALLAVATGLDAVRGEALLSGWPRGLFFMLAAAFGGLLVYTLFFALPTQASYACPGQERPVVTRGLYALCRHPGVLWFVGLYGCLWLATGVSFMTAVLYSVLNFLLVLFEDRYVFPGRLAGYAAYSRVTPFLMPTAASFRACCGRS